MSFLSAGHWIVHYLIKEFIKVILPVANQVMFLVNQDYFMTEPNLTKKKFLFIIFISHQLLFKNQKHISFRKDGGQ